MRFLRQSTASQEILLGPFVATADGTAQTGLTIANTDIKLLPGGATSESNKNSGGGTHIAGGRYSAVLDATDTATVGILEVSVAPASGIPWNKSYYILEEAVYDALFAASAPGYLQPTTAGRTLDVAATGEAGVDFDNILLTNGAPKAGIHASGTLSGTHSATTADLGTNAPASGLIVVGMTLYFPAHGLSVLVSSYNDTTGVATFDAVTVTLVNGNVWFLFPTAAGSGGSGLDAAGVRAAVGLASANLDTQLGAIDDLLDSEIPALTTAVADLPTNAELATALGTADDAVLAAIAALNNLSQANVRSAVGLASANLDTQLATIDDLLDTEIPALTTAVADLPTNAELATALGTADDAVLAQIALVKANTDKFANLPVVTAAGTGGQGFGAP